MGGAQKGLREHKTIRLLANLGEEHFLVSARASMSAVVLRRDLEEHMKWGKGGVPKEVARIGDPGKRWGGDCKKLRAEVVGSGRMGKELSAVDPKDCGPSQASASVALEGALRNESVLAGSKFREWACFWM